MDPAVCLAPGLFRSLASKERRTDNKGEPLRIHYDHGRARILFEMPTALGCDDMRILQAVTALAPREPLAIGPNTLSEPLAGVRGRLDLVSDARSMEVLSIRTGFAEVTRIAGYGRGGDVHGGGLRRHLCACLRRLAAVKVTIEEPDPNGEGRRSLGWRLIAHDLPDDDKFGSILIALNPRSSQAALARRQFTPLDLKAARMLQTNPERLLHQRLSALVDAKGQAKAIRMGTMMGYVWGVDDVAAQADQGRRAPTPSYLRKRRTSLAAALEGLRTLGWGIDLIAGYPDTRLIRQPRPDQATTGKVGVARGGSAGRAFLQARATASGTAGSLQSADDRHCVQKREANTPS